MVNVWTVLWVGDKPWAYTTRPKDRPLPDHPETREYKPADVIKHKRMVQRWIPDATFRCLSNVDIPGVETIPLISGMEGWWPKMELWRPDLPGGRNVYFDLDTVIIRNPRAIVDFQAPFAAIMPGRGVGSADLNNPRSREPWPAWQDHEGFWRYPRYQTSVMVWDSEYGHKFWNTFTPEAKAHVASDQDFLGKYHRDEGRMPTEWFKKIPSKGSKPHEPVMVVLCMPMRNDEAARRFDWVAKVWK